MVIDCLYLMVAWGYNQSCDDHHGLKEPTDFSQSVKESVRFPVVLSIDLGKVDQYFYFIVAVLYGVFSVDSEISVFSIIRAIR